ncbi:unnamed protein product [Lactuca virosa]|uniref:Uncharacterized protein n=1 Tax=Lactuca virosa TaxID=75947 RepID=A0AAU9LGX5_9ASTR|nr:unnamed protein product [Lactuca virosa]
MKSTSVETMLQTLCTYLRKRIKMLEAAMTNIEEDMGTMNEYDANLQRHPRFTTFAMCEKLLADANAEDGYMQDNISTMIANVKKRIATYKTIIKELPYNYA